MSLRSVWMSLALGLALQPSCGDSSFRDGAFWDLIEVDGEWVENFPSLEALYESSDVAVLGDIVAVRGQVIQGDAREDKAYELEAQVESRDALKHAINTDLPLNVRFTVGYNFAVEGDWQHALADAMRDVPVRDVLLLLRRRADGSYRPVNGDSIWAATSRSNLDTPLNPHPPSESALGVEVRDVRTVQELKATLIGNDR